MNITVKLFATFRFGRFAAATRQYPPSTQIGEVISELQIPESQVSMIMLNGRHANPDQRLNDGDSLALFPLVAGG
ncbi:MoaD/ThiS family protein [Geobacter hydrogenophilus]|nr:MoaD/ThiS family protein [Geobacter hydrogenophilus]MBT0894497.1 MoaD/ThiS family protein [Geobacter hydrogenophilus]